MSVHRATSLGSLHVLHDQLIFSILLLFRPSYLARTLPLVSKYFYVFCQSEDLWRPVCIEKFFGKLEFLDTYRATYAGRPLPPSTNIRLDGFFSDYLNFRYYVSSIDLKAFAADSGQVPHCASKDMSYEHFADEFDSPGRIVVFNDMVQDWPAAKLWTLEQLAARFPDQEFMIGQKIAGKRFGMTLARYMKYSRAQKEEEPLYVFDDSFGENTPQLLQDYAVHPFFADDWLSLLGSSRPNFRWIVIGPARSGSGWHVDPTGRKRWAFYPPGHTPPGVWVNKKGKYRSQYPLEWFLYTLPNLPPEQRPIEVMQHAGETVFVPRGWWHTVLNIEETVAVTQNFVNQRNFKDCLEELLEDRREEEFETLTSKLPEKFPHLAQWVADTKHKVQKEATERAQREKFPYATAVPEVCSLHSLAPKTPLGLPAHAEPAESSTNLVYFYGDSVVKFYTRNDGSFHKELEIYAKLSSDGSPPIFPRVKGSGLYVDADKKEWPYMITELVEGEPVGAVFPSLTHENQLKVAEFAAQALRRVHAIPASSLSSLEPTGSGWPSFLAHLAGQRAEASTRHAAWATMPGSLRAQLESYLPSGDKLVAMVDTTRPPVLLHSDLNDENLLGHFPDEDDSEDEEEEEEAGDGAPEEGPSEPWQPTNVIDFGDARVGDPLWDLTPLHVSCFRCDKRLLRHFLQSLGFDPSRVPNWPHHAMTYLLLHDCDAMSSVYEWRPDLRGLRSLDELARALWDLDAP